jgi:hypothetical protein
MGNMIGIMFVGSISIKLLRDFTHSLGRPMGNMIGIMFVAYAKCGTIRLP